MANNEINVRVKQKYDTEANWKSKNPVLLKGEIAFSSDKNNKYKVGDGTKNWVSLSYNSDNFIEKQGGGTINGSLTVTDTATVNRGEFSTVESDSLVAGDVLVNGALRSVNEFLGNKVTANTINAETITGNLTGNVTGNANTATTLANGRTITVGNTGKQFNGSKDISFSLSEIGAASASHGTHVSYSTTNPVMDGTASVGTASTVARSDHKHPTDTSRASQSSLDNHTGNTTNHITATERTNWNAAKTHADSTHARTDATKVEASSTNGSIKINGTDTTVYTHPTGTNPHGTTKSDVGLGNVGNFKAVSTVASQGLTDQEKANARANIGAGASSFTGSYNDLSDKPTIPTKTSQLTNDSGYKTTDNNTTYTLTQDANNGHKITFTPSSGTATTITIPDNNTTYSAGTGISLSGTTFSNSGVRAISSGSANGTISVNTNGTSSDVAVKGLGSAAYTASTAYATSSHTHSYLPLSGGTLTGELKIQKATNSTVTYGDKTNPRITFSDSDGSQSISLVYTDYDTYQAPDSVTLVGNQTGAYFIAPNIKSTSKMYATSGVKIGNAVDLVYDATNKCLNFVFS